MFRLLLLCCLISSFAFAQNKYRDAGYLIYLLGSDTTMAGSYSLDGNDFDIEVVSRPSVAVTKIKGSLNARGELQSAEGYSYKPVPGKDSQMIVSYKLYIRNDSTIIEQTRGKDVSTQRFAGQGMTANGIGVAFRYLLPFWPRYAPKQKGDSVVSGHLTLGANKKLTITRTAADKLYAGSTVMGMVTLHLDKNGKLTYIDGLGSSWNTTAKVTRPINLKQLAERYAQEEQHGMGLKVINLPDSVIANIHGTSVKINYSRPQVRGRTIFGSVVPWNRWWRTGANAATRLTIDRPLYFGGKELPAGSYSVFTLPAQNGWTIMFNSRANIWGTEYDPAFDVLRVPMQAGPSGQFTEVMTITMQSKDNGGELNILWENMKASVAFRTANQ